MKLGSLETIIRALDEAGARYLVVGGLAVAAHGYGRLTFDLDLVLEMIPENIEKAIRSLQSLGYQPLIPLSAMDFANPEERQRWIKEKNMVVFQLHSDEHPETRIDLFVEEPFRFGEEFEKALSGELIPGFPIHFVSLNTLIKMKEVSDREKDREDIRQLKRIQELEAGGQ